MSNTTGHEEHLRPEEIDAIALEGDRALPARSSAHVAACERCRGEVGELKRLHAALASLDFPRPRAGLADRVMQRVSLPLPWRRRTLLKVRQHRVATAAAFAGVLSGVALGLQAMSRYPELTPPAIATFLVERLGAIAWSAVMYVGQLVVRTGLLAVLQGATAQLTPITGFVAVATVTLVGLGALRVLLSLMNAPVGARPAPEQ